MTKIDNINNSLIDTDSTAVIEINLIQKNDNGKYLMDSALYKKIKKYIGGSISHDKKSNPEKIKTGLDLFTNFNTQYNKAWNAMQAIFADYDILRGELLSILKRLVGGIWEIWSSENLEFISYKTKQNLLLLSERKDVHNYSFLGIDRMLQIINSTEDSNEKNPITQLTNKYKISFNPEKESLLSDFKNMVDTIVTFESIEKFGIDIDFETIKTLISLGIKLNKNKIKKLAKHQKEGKDLKEKIDNLILNNGCERKNYKRKVKIEGFSKLAARMKESIAEIIKQPEFKAQISKEQIESLEANIRQLKASIINKNTRSLLK